MCIVVVFGYSSSNYNSLTSSSLKQNYSTKLSEF